MKSATSPAVVSLGLTKGGKRVGAAESITVTVNVALKWLWMWKAQNAPSAKFVPSVSTWRILFKTCLAALEINLFEFRPYSLRRGGATFWLAKHGSLDKLLISGRRQAAKTARIYINEGMAVLADMKLATQKFTLYVRVFHNQNFPPHLSSRSRARRGAWKEVFFLPVFALKSKTWPRALGLAGGPRKVVGGFPIPQASPADQLTITLVLPVSKAFGAQFSSPPPSDFGMMFLLTFVINCGAPLKKSGFLSFWVSYRI